MRFLFVVSLLVSFALPVFAQRAASTAAAERYEFARKKIKLGAHTLTVEIADTPRLRERGLMFRKKLEPNSGMLFVFERVQPMAFWMKNTLIPLSIAYIDEHKKIVDIKDMEPAVMGAQFPPSYPSKAPAMYALEMPKGWFAKNGIKIGDSFSFAEDVGKRP